MQTSGVCRICGGTGLLLQILDKETNYQEDIEDCLSVKVTLDDGDSQVICHKCVGTLSMCKSYVTQINTIKKDNNQPPAKKCYTCRSTKAHLFPFPESSAVKLEEFFGLNVMKPNKSKICHECQYFLDCVSDLRDKAKIANKLFNCDQDLNSRISQKKATFDDLVDGLKDREVEVDGGSLSRNKARITKSPEVSSRKRPSSKQDNGKSSNLSKDLSMRKSSSRKKRSTMEDDGSDAEVDSRKKHLVKDNSVAENKSLNNSPKESVPRKKRQLSCSSGSDLNISTETAKDEKVERSLAKDSNKTKRSLNDQIDLKQDSPFKRPNKSKDPKEAVKAKPSPRSKRSGGKNDKYSGGGSDSENDSMCLASYVDSGDQSNKAILNEKSSKQPRRSSGKAPTDKVVESSTPQKKTGRREKKQHLDNESESPGNKGLSKRALSDLESHLDSKRRKVADNGRKKQVNPRTLDENKMKKKPPLKAYTCTICSDDFRSTVEGREHELSHDERFNKFEIKMVRLSSSDISQATEKSSSKGLSKNEEDDDDLWSMRNSKETKSDSAVKEDAFDALFGGECGSEPAITKVLESEEAPKEDEAKRFNNSSDSEEEDAKENTTKLDSDPETSKTDEKANFPEKFDKGTEPVATDETSEPANDEQAGKNLESEESEEVQPDSTSPEVEKGDEESSKEKEDCTDDRADQSEANDSVSEETQISEPRNDNIEESKVVESDEEKEIPMDDHAPIEKDNELNGTEDPVHDISLNGKEETNSEVETPSKDDSCAEAKSQFVEPPLADQDNLDSSIKEVDSAKITSESNIEAE